jgi:hypothetical protein
MAAVEPHNRLHLRLPLPLSLLFPLSPSSVSPLPPPPLLFLFSDPATIYPDLGLPRLNPGCGRPFRAIALGAVVSSIAPRAPGVWASALVMGSSGATVASAVQPWWSRRVGQHS